MKNIKMISIVFAILFAISLKYHFLMWILCLACAVAFYFKFKELEKHEQSKSQIDTKLDAFHKSLIDNVKTADDLPDNPTYDDYFHSMGRLSNQVFDVFSLMGTVSSGQSFGEVFFQIQQHFGRVIPFKHFAFGMVDYDQSLIRIEMQNSAMGIEIPHNLELSRFDAHDKEIFFEHPVQNIVELTEDCIADNPSLNVYYSAGLRSLLSLPVTLNQNVVAVLLFFDDSSRSYKNLNIPFVEELTQIVSQSFEKCIYMDELISATLIGLASLAEFRDTDTGAHLQRMSHYSRITAMGLAESEKYQSIIDDDYIRDIFHFSPLHDIGKVGIPDQILLKPARLTEDEWVTMKKHTTYGAEVLREADEQLKSKGKSMFFLGIQIAEAHHEKWDGSGYPYGLKGDQIPLSARIVAVADVFDALTSKRCYKEPFSMEKALAIIEDGRGSHFDPDVLDAFLGNLDKITRISQTYKG